jgi:mono/diheme cytochrome c family protein
MRAAAFLVTIVLGAPVLLTGCGSDSGNTDDQVAGKQLFVKNCGSCHILSRAGTKGTTGPNLDQAFQQSLKDGFGRASVAGVVKHQIEYPNTQGVMPAKIVDGQQADDVAAYVADAVAKPGKDTGILADAVKSAGAGKPIAAKNGAISIAADPNGQLAYVSNKATAAAGPLAISMPNMSGTDHNLAIQKGTNGPVLAKTPIIKKGVAKTTVTLTPGTYTYFCEVPGHRAAGMLGTLTVK